MKLKMINTYLHFLKILRDELGPCSMATSVKTGARIIAEEYELFQNYPNPFNPVTHIPLLAGDLQSPAEPIVFGIVFPIKLIFNPQFIDSASDSLKKKVKRLFPLRASTECCYPRHSINIFRLEKKEIRSETNQ